MFEKPGSGGVGVGPNSAFGNQFGAYADLVVQRVTEKWDTSGLAGLHLPMAVITFDILRDGSVKNPQIAQRSGNSTLDFSALRAVTDAGALSSAPAQLQRELKQTWNSDFNYSDETNYSLSSVHCSAVAVFTRRTAD